MRMAPERCSTATRYLRSLAILLVCVFFITPGTQAQNSLTSSQNTKTNVAPPSEPLSGPQIVKRFAAAFNLKDVAAMLALVTDDVELLSVDGTKITPKAVNKEALGKALAGQFRSCPSCLSELTDVREIGSRVTAMDISASTPNGVFGSQRNLSVYEFRDGRLRRIYYFAPEP